MFLSRCFAVILAGVVFQAQSLALEPATTGEQLLRQMAEANRELNYTGIFTYEHGGTLKTVKVFHAVKGDKEVERLVLLSGPKQEVVRRGTDVDCQHIGDAMLRGNARGIANLANHHLGNYYSVQVKPDDRVAGRNVAVLHVVPLDEHRYGYVLGLDKETGLLLQSLLIGDKKRVLERFQYVDVDIGAEISEAELNPGSEHYLVSPDQAPCTSNDSREVATSPNWDTGWLPPGYAVAGYDRAADGGRETLIFTDGLSVFSLFIDSNMAADLPQMQAQRGATVAYLSRVDHDGRQYTICVVGEIPVETAKLVAHSVTPRSPAP